MSVTLEDLWKTASNEEVVEAIGRWQSTNLQGRRALAAEVKRRNLDVALPELPAAADAAEAAPAAAASPVSGMALLVIVLAIAAVAAFAAFVG